MSATKSNSNDNPSDEEAKRRAELQASSAPGNPARPQQGEVSQNVVSSASELKRPKTLAVSYETARKRLIERHGYAEDEVTALFPVGKESELLSFYNVTLAGLNQKNAELEATIGWADGDDSFDLNESEKSRLGTTKHFREVADAAAQQEKIPDHAKVSPEELARTKRDLADLLNDEI